MKRNYLQGQKHEVMSSIVFLWNGFDIVCGLCLQDVSPGFVLCSPENLCHTGRIFDAQVHYFKRINQVLKVSKFTHENALRSKEQPLDTVLRIILVSC